MKFYQIEPFFDGVNIVLTAAKGDSRETVGRKPIGIKTAVSDGVLHFRPFGFHCRRGCKGRGVVTCDTERFIIQLALAGHFSPLAFRALYLLRGALERLFNLTHNPLTKLAIVAPRFRKNLYTIADDIGSSAAFDYTDVAGAPLVAFDDQSMPAIPH